MIIPNHRVAYVEARLSQVESMVNGMWADRSNLDIQGQNAADIEHHINRLEYVAGTLRDLLTTKQQPAVLPLAAE